MGLTNKAPNFQADDKEVKTVNNIIAPSSLLQEREEVRHHYQLKAP
jgi:hypothetical protein